ncbi:hypothetical protein V8C86DRAFT_2705816 [Haematococcus lacustris]
MRWSMLCSVLTKIASSLESVEAGLGGHSRRGHAPGGRAAAWASPPDPGAPPEVAIQVGKGLEGKRAGPHLPSVLAGCSGEVWASHPTYQML